MIIIYDYYSCFRETHSIEHHVAGLVRLLEVCYTHNLKPTVKDSDPPHAKIASDIMSCLFMVCIFEGCCLSSFGKTD